MDQLMLSSVLLQIDNFPLADVWGSAIGFITIFVIAVGAIGLGSRSLAVASMSAYLTFAYFASQSGIVLLENILYVTLTLVAIGTAMKMWRLEGFETGS